MVNNGSLTYDHSKDGRWTELAGCTADLRNQNHDTFLAIRYSRGRLTVSCGGSIAPVRRGSAGRGGGVAGGSGFPGSASCSPAPLALKLLSAGREDSWCSW